jgi:hypothetical protein
MRAVVLDAWTARRNTGLDCWCGEPIQHSGWPVCADRAVPVTGTAIGTSGAGCCSGCQGTGYSGDTETNGSCWDCRGTGCAHPEPCASDDEAVRDA